MEFFRKNLIILIVAFFVSVLLVLLFVWYSSLETSEEKAKVCLNDFNVATDEVLTKEVSFMSQLEFELETERFAVRKLLKYFTCSIRKNPDFYNTAKELLPIVVFDNEEVKNTYFGYFDNALKLTDDQGEPEECLVYRDHVVNAVCLGDAYLSCLSETKKMSADELANNLRDTVHVDDQKSDYLSCVESASLLKEKGPFSTEFVERFPQVCKNENWTPKECLENLSSSFTVQLAWGEFDEICPNELEELCMDQWPGTVGVEDDCRLTCDLIVDYSQDKSLFEKNMNDVVNLVTKNKIINEKLYRQRASWVYRILGVGAVLDFCEKIPVDERKNCVFWANLLGTKDNLDESKMCDGLRNQVEGFLCLTEGD